MQDVFHLLIPIALLLIIIGWGLRLLLGQAATEQMVGTLAADVVRFLFLFPFRVLRWLARLLKLIP